MTTWAAISLRCPVCGRRFQSADVQSVEKVGRDSDFRPHFVGLDPLPLLVHTCPGCLFTARAGDFEGHMEISRDWVAERPARLEWTGEGQLRGSDKFRLAAQCYERRRKAQESVIGELFLQASWCARKEGRREVEQECQEAAIDHYNRALERHEIPEEEVPVVLYLVGELYRRLSKFELANGYLLLAKDLAHKTERPDAWEQIIDAQMERVAQGISENTAMPAIEVEEEAET